MAFYKPEESEDVQEDDFEIEEDERLSVSQQCSSVIALTANTDDLHLAWTTEAFGRSG